MSDLTIHKSRHYYEPQQQYWKLDAASPLTLENITAILNQLAPEVSQEVLNDLENETPGISVHFSSTVYR